jgi:hypothetical protein
VNAPNSRDYGRGIDQPAQVAGEAEAARVGESLAVGQQQVGGAGERRQSVEHRRDLAKRQQPRYVGDRGRPARQRRLDQLQIRNPQHRDRRPGDAAALLEPDVDAGDQSGRAQAIA